MHLQSVKGLTHQNYVTRQQQNKKWLEKIEKEHSYPLLKIAAKFSPVHTREIYNLCKKIYKIGPSPMIDTFPNRRVQYCAFSK